MGVRGDATLLVERAEAGVSVTPEDADSIADGIEKISLLTVEQRNQMGRNAAAFYQNELSLKVGVGKFSELVTRVARRPALAGKGKLS